MSNKAIIKDGVVVNIGIASDNDSIQPDIVPIPEGQKVSIGYAYSDGKFIAPIEQGKSLQDLKESKVSILNSQLQRYVYGVYDIGTQASFQALYMLPITQESKDAIASVWGWIQSVLVYYYQCKDEILNLSTIESVSSYKWDFEAFKPPSASLSEILKDLA